MNAELKKEKLSEMNSCKELIFFLQKRLNIQYVRVCFYAKGLIKERLIRGRHIVFFTPIDSESERERYERKSESAQTNYTTKSPMIHFPDVTIDELIQIFQCGVEDESANTISRLKNEYDIEADKYIFIAFLFLHEVGHWNQLIADDHKVRIFLLRDFEEEKRNHDAQSAIINSALRKNGNNKLVNGFGLNNKEKEKLRKLQEEYRRIPKEADADKYAVEMLKSIVSL